MIRRPERSRTVLVEIGGRTRRVEVGRAGNGWVASIDGRVVRVDAAQVGEWMSLLVGPPEGGPHDKEDVAAAAHTENVGAAFRRPKASYVVAIDDGGRGELVVHVNGAAIPVAVRDPRAAARVRSHDATTNAGGRVDVRAPMPGRIVKVLVRQGDTVTARQGLVVVEAMKMENELRAPKDGRVADIRVTEGMSVEANAVLVTLE